MILTYHVTEQSWGKKPKLGICWQGKERRKKKKKDREGQSEGEEIKRERGKEERPLGTEVEWEKELQDLKPTVQFSLFLSCLFPRGDVYPVILVTEAPLQALFSEVDPEKLKPWVSSLACRRVDSLGMDRFFSLRYAYGLWAQTFIFRSA